MADLPITANLDRVTHEDFPFYKFIISKSLVLGTLFNTNRTGQANIFTTDITPNTIPCTVKVWIDIDSALDIFLIRKKNAVSKEAILGTTTANKPLIIEIPFSSTGETFNIRTSAIVAQNYNIGYISVVEMITYLK